jgi:glycosyltransferase involved in cell wall biosynthesis
LESRAAPVVPGKIRFVGFVQKEQLPAYYALCDALMFPTHSDPWGLVVNEAMASGSAIVTTDVAGCAADLVENGGNGFVVASKSVTPLADAMQNLVSHDELRRQMGLRSIDRIQDYSPDACAAGIARAAGVDCEERP